ncbi:MAG: hypothetical protein FJ312_10140 [SAR202 cluster bacterium]|nr:hypothetical protein [SAR202 cluster bacterium]
MLFFGGKGDRYGPLNEFFSATTPVLLILLAIWIYAIARRETGPWFDIVTWLAVGGMAVAATGQFLLIMGGISLGTSFMTGGAGILPVFAQWAALALLAVGRHLLWAPMGWLAIACLGLSALLMAVWGLRLKAAIRPIGVALTLALAAWMGTLVWDLLRNA